MSESNRLLNFATSSELIANGEGRNVLSAIEDGLRNCDEFLISVAFITPEGLLTLKPILKELEERGVHGRVLTTDYLGFNSPKVLEDLGSLNNIDLKVYCTTQGSNHGFHTKGYIFKKDESYQIIVGSSNLTINALKKNREWNTRSEAHCDDTYAREITEEFDLYWNSEFAIPYEEFIPWYRPRWVRPDHTSQKNIAEQFRKVDLVQLEPNSMQEQFINNFNELRANNSKRGLLISALRLHQKRHRPLLFRQICQDRHPSVRPVPRGPAAGASHRRRHPEERAVRAPVPQARPGCGPADGPAAGSAGAAAPLCGRRGQLYPRGPGPEHAHP
nr:phospholipase D-like domain-containing protein [Veillonella dispar]